jgi:hypothetical protein
MKPLISQQQRRLCMLFMQGVLVTATVFFPRTGCLSASAAEVKLVPACEVKEEFNDNIYLAAASPKSDVIINITPSVAFSTASERLSIDLLAGLSWHKYAQSAGDGQTDFQYNAQMTNRLTPRDDFGLSALYVRNSRPGSINLTTGLPTGSGSDHYQYSGNVKRVLDETASASLAYSFVKDVYDNPDAQGNNVHDASLTVAKDLSAVMPALKGTFSTLFSRALYRDSTSDNYTLKVGLSRTINEKLGVNFSGGGQLIHSTFMAPTETSSDSWGVVGAASLSWSGENSSGSFSATRNYTPASGQTGAVETSTFGLTVGQSVSETVTFQGTASYSINQASGGQFSSRSSDDRALNLKADFMYKISNFFDAGLQYGFYTVTYSSTDLRVAQNSVMLRVVAKYPVSW